MFMIMDDKIRKNFTIPKTFVAEKDYLIPDNKTSRNTIDLFNDISSSYLDQSFDLKKNEIENIYFFRNPQLNKHFTEKKASFDKNYKEKFVFQILPTLDVARSIASNGIRCDQLSLFVNDRLGQSSQGVHVLRHADIALTVTGSQKLFQFGLLICKVVLSKGYCTIPDVKNATLACQPNYDYHYGKRNPSKEESWKEKYAHSLLYVCEYNLTTMTHTLQPPQILPIACLWYQLNESFFCEFSTIKIPRLIRGSSLKIARTAHKKIARHFVNKSSISNQEKSTNNETSPIQSVITNRTTLSENISNGRRDVITIVAETHSSKQQQTVVNQSNPLKNITSIIPNLTTANSTVATPIVIKKTPDMFLKLGSSLNRSMSSSANHPLMKQQNVMSHSYNDVNDALQNNYSSLNSNVNSNNTDVTYSLFTPVSSDFLTSDKQSSSFSVNEKPPFLPPNLRDPRIRRAITTTKKPLSSSSTLNTNDLNCNTLSISPDTISSPSPSITPTEVTKQIVTATVTVPKKTISIKSLSNEQLHHKSKTNSVVQQQQQIIRQNDTSPTTPVTPTTITNDDTVLKQRDPNPLFASITSLDVPLEMNISVSDPRLQSNRKKVIYCLEPHAVKHAIQQQRRVSLYNANATNGNTKSVYHLIPFLIKQISFDENENENSNIILSTTSSLISTKQRNRKNDGLLSCLPTSASPASPEKLVDKCYPLRVVVQDVINFNFDFTSSNENYIDLNNETNQNAMRLVTNFNDKIQQNREKNALRQRLKQSLKKKRVRKRKTKVHVPSEQFVENENKNLTVEQQQLESTKIVENEEMFTPTTITVSETTEKNQIPPSQSNGNSNSEAIVKDTSRSHYINGLEILKKHRRQNIHINIPQSVSDFLSKEYCEEKRPYVKRLLARLMGILDEKYGRTASNNEIILQNDNRNHTTRENNGSEQILNNTTMVDNSDVIDMELSCEDDVRLDDCDERFPLNSRKIQNPTHSSISFSDNHNKNDSSTQSQQLSQTHQNTHDFKNPVFDERMKEIIDGLRSMHQPLTQQLSSQQVNIETTSIPEQQQSKTADDLVSAFLIESSSENSTPNSSRKQSSSEINNHILQYQQPSNDALLDIISKIPQKPIETHKEMTKNDSTKHNTLAVILETFTKPDSKLNSLSTQKLISSKPVDNVSFRNQSSESRSLTRVRTYSSSTSTSTDSSSSSTNSSSTSSSSSPRHRRSKRNNQSRSTRTPSPRRRSLKRAPLVVSSPPKTASRLDFYNRHDRPSQPIKTLASQRTVTPLKPLMKLPLSPSTNRHRPSVSSSSQQPIIPAPLTSVVPTPIPSRSMNINLSHIISDNSPSVIPQYSTTTNPYSSGLEFRRRIESYDDIIDNDANKNDDFGLTVDYKKKTTKISKKRQLEQSKSLEDEQEAVDENKDEAEINSPTTTTTTTTTINDTEPIVKRIKVGNFDVTEQKQDQQQEQQQPDSTLDESDITDVHNDQTGTINSKDINEKESMINENDKINDDGLQCSSDTIVLSQLQNDNILNDIDGDVRDRDYRFDFDDGATSNQQSQLDSIKTPTENTSIDQQNDLDERLDSINNSTIDNEKENVSDSNSRRRTKSRSHSQRSTSIKDEKIDSSRLSSTSSRNSSKNSFYRNNNRRNSKSPTHHHSSSYHRHDSYTHHHSPHSRSRSSQKTNSSNCYHRRSTSRSTRSSRSRSRDKNRNNESSRHYGGRYYHTSTSDKKTTSHNRSHPSRRRQRTNAKHPQDNRRPQRDRKRSLSYERQHRHFRPLSKSPQDQEIHSSSSSLLPPPLMKTVFNNNEIQPSVEHELNRPWMNGSIQNDKNIQTRGPHRLFNYNHQRMINHPIMNNRYNDIQHDYYNKMDVVPSSPYPPHHSSQSTHDILNDNQHLHRSRSISPTHSSGRLRINCSFPERNSLHTHDYESIWNSNSYGHDLTTLGPTNSLIVPSYTEQLSPFERQIRFVPHSTSTLPHPPKLLIDTEITSIGSSPSCFSIPTHFDTYLRSSYAVRENRQQSSENNPVDLITDSTIELIPSISSDKHLNESKNIDPLIREQHIGDDIQNKTDTLLLNNEKDIDTTNLSPTHRTSAIARYRTTGLLPSPPPQPLLPTPASLTSSNHYSYRRTFPVQSSSSRFTTHEELTTNKQQSTAQHSTRLGTVQQIQQLLSTSNARQILHTTILQQIAGTRQHAPTTILNSLLQGKQQQTTSNNVTSTSRRLLTNTSSSTSSSTTTSSTSARSLSDHDAEQLLLLLQRLRS
ncbi:unnamed protein product [Didymodactylos carnosus]|uniref:DUF3715 domain-containing protein n=1 Tax=Didymodactylos carnosus TaxID=1234261 RepID=A0A814AKB9_9BILA|nr:unnamed protein product [Didymodactylos carnosus]CAF3695708.1 unnamed protein product [Didymodactylos carnosus]